MKYDKYRLVDTPLHRPLLCRLWGTWERLARTVLSQAPTN